MLKEKQIIKKLRDYGHLGPHLAQIPELSAAADVKPTDAEIDKLKITDKAVKQALASFQGFMAEDMERLSLAVRKSPSGMYGDGGVQLFGDGEFDEAVRALFDVKRCAVPDLLPDGFAASGSWQLPCRTEGVTFYVDKSGIPSSYAEFWDNEIIPEVIEAYRMVGARMKQINDRNAANIFNSFPSLPGGTIGLASLHAGPCSSRGFCRLDRGFRCNKQDAKRLLAHEWCHNWNGVHERSGDMAPSLRSSTAPYVGWTNDPAMRQWRRFTDGNPLPPINKPLSPSDFYTGL